MPLRHIALLTLTLLLALTSTASATPLTGSSFDTGDGNQDDTVSQDWQGAVGGGRVIASPDANDDCFVGGVKELSPKDWAFNRSAGGCTPGKSNLRVGFANAETTSVTSFGHFAFFRNDTTGNSFLTFELNQGASSWTNSTGTTIPCRSNGDLLLSFEVGGSSLTSSAYKWRGDFNPTPNHPCPYGGTGTFTGSSTLTAGSPRFQGTMNVASPIQNFVEPATYGATFPANAFGEAAVDLPAVLRAMGESPCFGFVQMQIHSRSSSSISSAMIDYTTPVPVNFQSCAATGTVHQDTNGNGVRDGGEPGLAGFTLYADLDDDGVKDAGEPSGESDAKGFYRLLNVPSGSVRIRQAPRAGWACSSPSPCSYLRSIPTDGNSVGNDFGVLGPSTASGTAFADLDADGVREAGEPGRGGVTVFADLDDDGVLDAGEPSGASDADGAWTVTDVPAGTHRLRQELTGGWSCSTPTPCFAERTFSSGSAASAIIFGSYGPVTIGGRVYEDGNGDGAAYGTGDTPVAGRQVYLDRNDNDLFDVGVDTPTTTDASGLYSFTGLTPGAYTVRVTHPTGWYGTSAAEHALTTQSAALATGRDFATSRYGTVSGTVFDDPNGNGIGDSGETTGLAGFTHWVDLDGDNALDADEPSAVSGASGAFSITGVPAGEWTLRQRPNGAYACTSPVPCTSAVTLASNGAATGRVFRAYVSRSVSGTVFGDADSDALAREAGEPGLAGWTVYSDANNNGVHDAGTEPVAVSNSLGVYNLTGLANGSYRIRLVGQSGWTCSFPASCLNTGSIGSGQSDTGKDFGLWGPATISGTVFDDADGDGAAPEPGESGIAHRTVWVDTTANGIRDAGEPTATTSSSGAWSIGGLNPGTYVVRTALDGSTCTRPVSCSYTVATATGPLSGRDFGSYVPASIAGVVREDTDADGTGDTALSGRTVYADLDGDGSPAGEPSATSAADGTYTLTGLAPGSYVVKQALPGGWRQSAPASSHAVTVVSGSAITGKAFASYTTGSITGTLYEDADFDGSAKAPADPGLAGQDVFLDLDGDRAHGGGEPLVTTDPSGDFAFAGLDPGTYAVRAVLPAGWACSSPSPCTRTAVVTSGGAATGNDFGGYEGAAVSGTIFEDADADGAARETGEQGAAGRRVYLDGPGGTVGVRDAHEPTVLTDANGGFSFTGITAQAWTVRLDLPAAWTCDSSPCALPLTLTSGAVVGGQELGVHTTGSIAGHLFTDRDANAAPQAFGENDQPERTVFLDANANDVVDPGERTATTDDNGDFTFTGLQPGDYLVKQVLPVGWTCSRPDPCSYSVTLSSSEAVTGRVFSSWTTASLTGVYFEDEDADGAYPEPGDGGLAGRSVYLDLNDDGDHDPIEPETTTGASGTFAFAGLQPRTYVVRSASQPADWTCSYPNDGACSSELTLEANEAAQDVDFGAWTDGAIEGVVFRDLDGDGAQDAGEAGLGGWTVKAGASTVTTAPDGSYAFAVPPGEYTVTRTAPNGWSCTSSPCSYDVTVTSDGAVTGRDFGNAQSTSVAGIVFVDDDADGIRDAGESPRAGAVVFLDDGTPNGTPDAGEPSTTTGSDGSYVLEAPAGTSRVRLQTPPGFSCAAPADCLHEPVLAHGDAEDGRDFAIYAPGTISGSAFEDVDGDGAARETGEPALAGRTVFLDDGSPNGTLDSGELSTTTAADGSWSFTGVTPGSRRVRIEVPDGWSCTRPSPCATDLALTSAGTPAAIDFGVSAVTADLSVALQRSAGPLVAGRPVGWTATVRNAGPWNATGTTATLTLPAALRDVTWTPPSGSTCGRAGAVLTCTIGALASGGDVVIAIDATVAPDAGGSSLDLEAAVTATQADPDASNDAAEDLAVPGAIADLEAKASLPASAQVGDTVDLVLTLSNDGPSDADAVVLRATLPAGIDPVPGSLPAGCTLAGRVVTCVASGLPVGTALERRIAAVIGEEAAERSLTIPVEGASSTPDPTPANDTADVAFRPVAAPRPAPQPRPEPVPAAVDRTPPLAIESAPAACASERAFAVRVRQRPGRRIARVAMWLGGKRLPVAKRDGRWTARIDLRGRTAGKYVLRIRARTAGGRVLRGKRTYRTCVDRLPYDTPPL